MSSRWSTLSRERANSSRLPLVLLSDFDHSEDEDRIRSIGPIERGVILVVSTELEDEATVRIISARFASPAERRRYAEMIVGES